MASVKWEAASIASLATTELNSLANNAAALGAEYDNTPGGANNYEAGLFELNVTFGTNPTAGAPVELYLIPAADGTNYDDGSATGPVAPTNSFIGACYVRAVTTAQKMILGVPGAVLGPILLPPVKFKMLVYNKSGQAFPASGSTLKMVPYRRQVA